MTASFQTVTSLPPKPERPAGFQSRRPREDDVPALVELYNAVARQRELPLSTEADILAHRTTPTWWQEALVIQRPNGKIAAYAHFAEEVTRNQERDLWIDGRVHPDATGHGLATYLLGRGERRVWLGDLRRHPGGRGAHERLALRTTSDNGNDRARALYERLGFSPVRHRLAMRVELQPNMPKSSRGWGVTVRPLALAADLRPLWRAMQDGFADHHDFQPTTFKEWRWILVDRHDDFDAGLWFVAEHGGEIIGGILCQQGVPEDPMMGHVRDLAVVPAWRRRGVADALLQSAFAAFASRGLRRAGLDVDDVNLGGAVRLYERAGMAVARRIDIYEKELRAAR